MSSRPNDDTIRNAVLYRNMKIKYLKVLTPRYRPVKIGLKNRSVEKFTSIKPFRKTQLK